MPGMTEGHHYSELPARRAASELIPPPDGVLTGITQSL